MLAVIPGNEGCVDSRIVQRFQKLATCGMVPGRVKPGHSDGWGMVTWSDGRPLYLGREPNDAAIDPRYKQACTRIHQLNLKSPLIVHLRKASVGLKIRENTHPFVIDEWAFAHNGTIRRLNLKVKTDSQWFFESLMREYSSNGKRMIEAIQNEVRLVHEIYPYTSVTFILSNGKVVYAYRDCSKNDNYYGLYYTTEDDKLVICQEKIFSSNWREIPNGDLFRVSADRSYEVIHIAKKIVASNPGI